MKKFKPGPLTEGNREDIRHFQEDKQIIVDGKIGRQTWGAIWSTIEELEYLVSQAEERANVLACENQKLMHGMEDTRGSSCIGCGFVGVVVGMCLVLAMSTFF